MKSDNGRQRQGQEDLSEKRHRSEHKRQWARAEFVANQCCPGGEVTQVGDLGFYVRAPGEVIAKFVSWSLRSDADTRFGRVRGAD